uniref:Uncharacterized protein n=1 Tax=mine drainage metagenome TaxID=410659 RepID=E6Q8U7_9ZZZZ
MPLLLHSSCCSFCGGCLSYNPLLRAAKRNEKPPVWGGQGLPGGGLFLVQMGRDCFSLYLFLSLLYFNVDSFTVRYFFFVFIAAHDHHRHLRHNLPNLIYWHYYSSYYLYRD